MAWTAAPGPSIGSLYSRQPEHLYTTLAGVPQSGRGDVAHIACFGLVGIALPDPLILLPGHFCCLPTVRLEEEPLLWVQALTGSSAARHMMQGEGGSHSVTQQTLGRVLSVLGSRDRADPFLP